MKPMIKEDVLEQSAMYAIEGVKVGKIQSISIDKGAHVCVDYAGNTFNHLRACFVKSIEWQSLMETREKQWEVLLAFENSDAPQPIIIDILCSAAENIVRAENFLFDVTSESEAEKDTIQEKAHLQPLP